MTDRWEGDRQVGGGQTGGRVTDRWEGDRQVGGGQTDER